jgi:hypothetical protein
VQSEKKSDVENSMGYELQVLRSTPKKHVDHLEGETRFVCDLSLGLLEEYTEKVSQMETLSIRFRR